MNMEDLELEEARRLVRERMRLRTRNGACCDEIEVNLWLPDLTRHNVTIFCDRLVLDDIDSGRQGFIAITTRAGDIGCFSYWNIEEQSSGFKLMDYIMDDVQNMGSVILEVAPSYVKKDLIVPNNELEGYYRLGEPKSNLVYTDNNSRRFPTSNFGHQYILNFSVGGEFKLFIDYFLEGGTNQKRIFERGFCCK